MLILEITSYVDIWGIADLCMPYLAASSFAFCVYKAKASAECALVTLHHAELEAFKGKRVGEKGSGRKATGR